MLLFGAVEECNDKNFEKLSPFIIYQRLLKKENLIKNVSICSQIQFKSRHLQNSMFRVVDGLAEVLVSPFSDRYNGEPIVDMVKRIPGQDYEKIRQGPQVPLDRAFPPPGGFV